MMMCEAPHISVIIPIFNVEPYIHQCLESIAKQSLRELEIICIDDGSTDNSAKIVQEYVKRDARFKLISIENSGPGIARNTGIKNATGKYIVFIDPDDWYPNDNTLSTIFSKIESSKCLVDRKSVV